jgi:FkbM family methyltransferase
MNDSLEASGLPEAICGKALVAMDPAHPEILGRKDSMDAHIYEHMFVWDEYKLKHREFQSTDRVLDIGGHAGYFTLCLLRRGVKQIHVYEVQPENLRLCRHHLQDAPETVRIYEEAVWDQSGKRLYLPETVPVFDGIENTGGFSLSDRGRLPVETIAFDQAVERLTEGFAHRIRLLKLDAEGAEWPILLTSKTLRYVDEIVGEFHEFGGEYDREVPEVFQREGQTAFTRQLLCRTLSKQGFRVRCDRRKSRFGIFFATRFRIPRAWWRGYK